MAKRTVGSNILNTQNRLIAIEGLCKESLIAIKVWMAKEDSEWLFRANEDLEQAIQAIQAMRSELGGQADTGLNFIHTTYPHRLKMALKHG